MEYRLIVLQLILLSIVTGIFAWINNWHDAVSVLLGGSAWAVPSLYFVRKFLKTKTIHDPQKMLNNFLLGEGIKLLLSAGLIILILLTVTVNSLGFLSGYITVIATTHLLPFLYKNKKL